MGEPQPPPAPEPPPATEDTKRDWPILLGQRLRDSDWVSPQVLLLGRIECRSPDPLTVLDIGGRYEINHRDLRAARRQLSEPEQVVVTAYLHRPSVYVESTGVDGSPFRREVPPPMTPEEELAYRHLWAVLAGMNALHRPTLQPKKESA